MEYHDSSFEGTIIYSVITPILCAFGICGNALSLLVLWRKEFCSSVYTYLTVLAFTDLMTSILLLLGGLSRGALYYKGWASYDTLVGLPLGGAFNFLSVSATVFVTIDRVIFLWDTTSVCKPAFCKPRIARRVMLISAIIAALFSIPYCFIFEETSDNEVTTTSFFDSNFYKVHNWICFVMFSILPSIILTIGNWFLIHSLKKARRIGKKFDSCRKNKKKDHRSLTIILILIILVFLLSEVPANLISRTSAVNLVFQGDHEKAKTKTVEIIRQVTTVIGAISITINFVLYYLFCPPFCKVLVKMFRGKRRRSTVQVNVFLVNNGYLNEKKKCSVILTEKIFKEIENSSESSMPSTLFNNGSSSDTSHHGNYCIMSNQTTTDAININEKYI